MYTVSNLQQQSVPTSSVTQYVYCIWVQARHGKTGKTSVFRAVFLIEKGMYLWRNLLYSLLVNIYHPSPYHSHGDHCSVHECFSGAPNCFGNIHVTYHPEGRSESPLKLSDPAATEVTLTDLQCKCNTNYTITVMAIAGVHALEEECNIFFHYEVQYSKYLVAYILCLLL